MEKMQQQRPERKVSTAVPTVPTPDQRYYLQKALHHVFIQFGTISPAALCYTGIALFLCVSMYDRCEQPNSSGGTQLEEYIVYAAYAVLATTCAFEAITLVAIGHRSYEPVFSSMISSIHPTSSQEPRAREAHSSLFETRTRTTAPLQGRHRAMAQIEEGSEVRDSEDRIYIREVVNSVKEDAPISITPQRPTSHVDPDDLFFKGRCGRVGGRHQSTFPTEE
jgi:hypothetical protein